MITNLSSQHRPGFTLIEILVVIGLIAILAGVVLAAVNPARQFAQARNAQRISSVHALLAAVGARTADTRGVFSDEACSPLPTIQSASISNVARGESYDLRPCLVPTYIPELPLDPVLGEMTEATYVTGYTIRQSSTTGRVSICSPGYGEPTLGLSGEEYCAER